jgi:hypothetical protein
MIAHYTNKNLTFEEREYYKENFRRNYLCQQHYQAREELHIQIELRELPFVGDLAYALGMEEKIDIMKSTIFLTV